MKSRAEILNLTVVNWKDVIKKYNNSMVYDASGYETHKDLLRDWNTCSCGQLPACIERIDTNSDDIDADSNGAPTDAVLNTLGRRVFESFEDREFENALNLLELIAVRGKYLTKKGVSVIKEKIATTRAELEKLEESVA